MSNCTPPQKLDQLKLSDFYYNINRSYNEKGRFTESKIVSILNEVISYDINPKTNLLDQITIGLHDLLKNTM